MVSCTRISVFFFVIVPLILVVFSVLVPRPVALASPISAPTSEWAHVIMDEHLAEVSESVGQVHTEVVRGTDDKHGRAVKTWGPPPLLQDEDREDKDDCSEDEEDHDDKDDEDVCSDDNDDARDSTEADDDASQQAERQQDHEVDSQGHVIHQTISNMLHPQPSLLTPPRKGIPLFSESASAALNIEAIATRALLSNHHRPPKIGLPVDTSVNDRHAGSTASVDRHIAGTAMTSSSRHHVSASTRASSHRLPECTEGVFPPGNAMRRHIEGHLDRQPCAPPGKSSPSHSRMGSKRCSSRPSSTHGPRRSSHKAHRTATATATATPTRSDDSHPSSWTQTMLTLADDTVLKKIDVWVPESESPEENARNFEKRQGPDDTVDQIDNHVAALTAAVKAFLDQDEVRPYLSLPHYVFVVSPEAITGEVNVSTVSFRQEGQATHNQLYRAALTAGSGAPWPRWPGPRQRVQSTSNVTWTVLLILPVLVLIALRIRCAGRLHRLFLLAPSLLVLCEWLILLDHNTKLFFDVPIEDREEGWWYFLYFSLWSLAISFAPIFYRWVDRCTGGRLQASLRRIIPAAVLAGSTARQRRPFPRRRNASNPAGLERIRGNVIFDADTNANALVCEPASAVPLPPVGPPTVVVAGEEDGGTQGRARRKARAVS